MGKQHSTQRHSARAATSTASIVSMVWSGGDEWLSSKANIVALSSILPSAMSLFQPWACCNSPVTKVQAQSISGTLILSIGGSSANDGGWSDMAKEGVDKWVGYFKNLFLTSGLNGIDWDLEMITTLSNYDFIGKVSQQLKAAGATITFTIFGNNKNPQFPPLSFLQTYADACTYVVLMLYGGDGMWVDATYGSWCDFASNTVATLPAALQSKYLYALYPSGATHSCCAPCIQKAVDNIRAGNGVGIAFWCYGGYLGACNTPLNLAVVTAWVDVLNEGGGTGVGDFLSAFVSCTGETATEGCGRSSIPTSTYYSCTGSTCSSAPLCTADGAGCYKTSTCENNCSTPTQNYKCNVSTTTCGPDASGTYSTYAACTLSCGKVNPQTYDCSCGACAKSTSGGKYTTSDCDGQCSVTPTLPCSSLGISVPTGGACSDTSAQFTCGGQNSCCCFGSIPSPNAINPTSCIPGTQNGMKAARFLIRY